MHKNKKTRRKNWKSNYELITIIIKAKRKTLFQQNSFILWYAKLNRLHGNCFVSLWRAGFSTLKLVHVLLVIYCSNRFPFFIVCCAFSVLQKRSLLDQGEALSVISLRPCRTGLDFKKFHLPLRTFCLLFMSCWLFDSINFKPQKICINFSLFCECCPREKVFVSYCCIKMKNSKRIIPEHNL